MPWSRHGSSARQRSTITGLVLSCLAASALLVGCGASSPPAEPSDDALGGEVQADRWQAVFLDTDRVFFGRLRALGHGWYRIEDAHFIREQAPQGEGEQARGAVQQVAPITEELQQPEPDLLVNGDHVVQVENLSDDSRVVRAIESLD